MDKENPVDDTTIDSVANKTKDVISNTSENAANAANAVNDITSKGLSQITDTYKTLATNSGILYGLLAVVIISVICALIIYYFVIKSVFNKVSFIVEKTKYPLKCNIMSVIDLEGIPSSSNGQRRTYTYWIYINDMIQNKGLYKNVFYVGDSSDGSLDNISPCVFLDKVDNKMHIRFTSKSPASTGKKLTTIVSNDDDVPVFKTVATIDYVPLQRWVHIGVVVNDNYQGGNITLYVDGELAKSINSGNVDNGVTKKYDNLNLDKMGKLYVGGDSKVGNVSGFSGLLSKVTFFNYDLNQADIINDYHKGPIDGVLASLGYGLRGPIYKL
jgi:hypothetical protein